MKTLQATCIESYNEVECGDFLIHIEAEQKLKVFKVLKEKGLNDALQILAAFCSTALCAHTDKVIFTLTQYDSPLDDRVIKKVTIQ